MFDEWRRSRGHGGLLRLLGAHAETVLAGQVINRAECAQADGPADVLEKLDGLLGDSHAGLRNLCQCGGEVVFALHVVCLSVSVKHTVQERIERVKLYF